MASRCLGSLGISRVLKSFFILGHPVAVVQTPVSKSQIQSGVQEFCLLLSIIMYWTRCMSRDKIIFVIPWQITWSLLVWSWSEGEQQLGHGQTESIQPTDRGVFALHWPARDKAEIITLLDTSHGGNFDPSGLSALCPCCYSWSELPQLIRIPANLWSNIDGRLSF